MEQRLIVWFRGTKKESKMWRKEEQLERDCNLVGLHRHARSVTVVDSFSSDLAE